MRKKVYIRAMYEPQAVWDYPIEIITNFASDVEMPVVLAAAEDLKRQSVSVEGFPYKLASLQVVVETVSEQ